MSTAMERGPVFVSPVFASRIWGGRKLHDVYGFDIPDGPVGECWAISAYPGSESAIREGRFAGMDLATLYAERPELFGKTPEEAAAGFPFLTKIIDAQGDLSIQVHPDDAYAGVHENGSRGKTECWYILDCPEGASLVAGHNAKDHDEFVQMIREDRWNELLRRVPVKPGDFIQIEPGTIHAITAGIVLLETQQSSDVTYRLYDYGRLENGKPRKLHLQQSIDVTTVPSPSTEELVQHFQDAPANEPTEMVRCKFYKVDILPVSGGCRLTRMGDYTLCTVAEGSGEVRYGDAVRPVRAGESFLLLSDTEAVELTGTMKLVISGEADA